MCDTSNAFNSDLLCHTHIKECLEYFQTRHLKQSLGYISEAATNTVNVISSP